MKNSISTCSPFGEKKCACNIMRLHTDACMTLCNINVMQKGSGGGKGQSIFLIAAIWTSNLKICNPTLLDGKLF